MKYIIKSDFINEGGSAEFYPIYGYKNLGFKQFSSKKEANYAYQKQKLLSSLGLAPKVIGKVCKLNIDLGYYKDKTNWGFITERARILTEKTFSKKIQDIQNLVDNIQEKTQLKFWDCHYYNLGYVKRKNKAKLVCIDTGKESFSPLCNAWGNQNPGPKCDYCDKYQCNCSEGY
jgi:hypothetical protein